MRQLTLVLFLLTSLCLYAQDIEVKKFEPMEKDQTAAVSPRKDINGTVCGLVKVALKEPGAEFEGNVMGDVQFTGSEYLVYMPNGSKRLGIKHPDYLPTTIVFADYGTKKVTSGTTYELKVKTNKKKVKVDNSKKGMAVFNVKPSNAMLLIDGQIADGSGGAYTLSLPYGTHYYTVKLKDFSINNQPVQIDKNAKNINVDLTEFFAKVDVSCKTEDADILINNEQKGVGKWGGMVIPGKYTIEAQKDGCHSQSRQIELKDNDIVSVDFTTLKTITGSLRIDYEPAGADVLLNSKKVGVTPLEIKELPVGNYQLEIWKEYYVKDFFNVKIAEDQEWREKGELKLTEFGELVKNAEGGPDSEYPERIIEYLLSGEFVGYRMEFGTCDRDSIIMQINPVEAFKWALKMSKSGIEVADNYLNPAFTSLPIEQMSFHLVSNMCNDQGLLRTTPYASLAWHYFYGVGCEKNIEEARRQMKRIDSYYHAYDELTKALGMTEKDFKRDNYE